MKFLWKRLRFLFLAAIFAALVVTGVLVAKKRKAALEKTPLPEAIPPGVQAELPVEGVFPVTSHFLGTLRAKVTANVSSRVQGSIVSLPFREGQRVEEGEIICLLDDRLEQARVRGIMAQLAAAKTNLATQEGIYQRDRVLFENKAISQEELDISRARRDAARGELRGLEAELEAAKTDLSYTRIVAPFDGVVTRRYLDPGDLALPGRPILQLESEERGYYVEIRVPQEEFSDFKIGQDVLISLKNNITHPGNPNRIWTHVSRVHPAVAAGGLAVLEADLAERPFGLPTGSFVNVMVVKDRLKGIKVPVRAILENVDNDYCFSVGRDHRVRVSRVDVLFMGQDYAILKSGSLDPSLPVVIGQESALLRLSQDMRVTVVPGKNAQDRDWR